jgi:hypothetical protein
MVNVESRWFVAGAGAWTIAESDRQGLEQSELLAAPVGAPTPDDEARAAVVSPTSPAPSGTWRQAAQVVAAQRSAAPDQWPPFLAGDLGASIARDRADLTRWRDVLHADHAFAAGELPDPAAGLERMGAAVEERAAAVEASRVRVVAQGIDTLHLSIWCAVAQSVRARLDALRDLAESEAVVIGAGDLRWTLAPHGRRGGYRYALEGPACSIAIRGRDTEGQASIFVELRSAWLWRMGPRSCVAEVLRVLQGWAPPGVVWPPRVTVARLDLAADVQGWAPRGDELTAPLGASPVWVSRTVSRTRYAEPEKAGTRARDLGADALHLRGRKFTGYSFGAGDLMARLYDKKAEIARSGKRWFGGVWAAGGAVQDDPVWRIEFQLRGDTLRELVCAVQDPRYQVVATRATDWHVILTSLDGLWSYLTARTGRGWLDLRDPPESAAEIRRAETLGRFERWPRSQAWIAVSALRWGVESQVARLPDRRTATASQTAAASRPDPTAPIPDLRPEDWRGAPSAATIARRAGRPSTVSAAAAVRDLASAEARALAADTQIEAISERADRLRAQLVGTAATYAAALAGAQGEDLPRSDEEARSLLLAALDWALSGASASDLPVARVQPGICDAVVSRRARGPTAGAVRRDLASASGVWNRRIP